MSIGKNRLKPLLSKIKSKNIWGFDIETKGNENNFVMGSIYGDNNINKTFWDKNEFIEYLFKHKSIFRNGYITATNLQFDALALFENTKYFKEIKPIIRNSTFICMLIDTGHSNYIKFIDTLNFNRLSVASMGAILGIPKLQKPQCFKRDPETEAEKEELATYNLNDSYITYMYTKKLQDSFNELGANLKITIASTSMDLYRRTYLKNVYFQPERHLLTYLYKGYYGGRTEVIKRGKVKNLNYYDVNSLYPSVMVNEYPNPNRIKYSKNIKLKTIFEYEGVARVRIEAPDLYIPYLPFRTEDKLIFPKGVFEGYYTFFELRKAFELGYTILKIYDAVIYFTKCRPFKNYVTDLYNKRKEYKKVGDVREQDVKLCLNSLYGKFAQKIDKKEKIIHKDKMFIGDFDKYDNITRSGNFFIINEPYKYIPNFVNPIFSIYTTAYARDKLYEFITKNPKSTYYYDTDSLFTSLDLDTSLALGDMKKEFTIKQGILVKPKMYLIDDKIKCKGVFGLDRNKFFNILNNQSVKMQKFVKFKEANKRGLKYNEIIDIEKFLTLEDNKRSWGASFDPEELQDSAPLTIQI